MPYQHSPSHGAGIGVCPFTLALFAGSVAAYTYLVAHKTTSTQTSKDNDANDSSSSKDKSSSSSNSPPIFQIVFVLGGPGSGKGTQCTLLKERLGWAHLSAGDLLRAERKKTNSAVGDLINEKINNGQIVPSEITVGLLKQGMADVYAAEGTTQFLIDGFPRSQGNVTAWEDLCAEHTIEFVLVLDCPEQVLESRLLERGKDSGRTDDNLDVIRKRFKTNQEETYPIVQQYEQKGMVRTVVADRSIEDVYQEVSGLFATL
mmetsp:Transcript_14592/g.22805  ORF Transcript_14592/g.22805 Transcript_14592/m.22805 type:complete len:260 (-) Transcript_14592:1121-1900(-)